jgi:hypothetical protein
MKVSQVVMNYGSGLMDRYNNSLYDLLCNVFPEINWKPWKFHQVSRGFWNDRENCYEYLKWLSDRLCIQNVDEWYQVSISKDVGSY